MKPSRFFFVLFAGTLLFAGCGVKNPFDGGSQTQETQQVALPSSTEQASREATFDPPSYRADYSTAEASVQPYGNVQPDGKGPRTLASTLVTVTAPTTYVVEGDNGESYQVTVEPVGSAPTPTVNYASTVSYAPVSAGRTVRHSYYAASTDTIKYNVSTASATTASRPFHGLSGYGTQTYSSTTTRCPNPDIYTPASPNCVYQTTAPFHGLR